MSLILVEDPCTSFGDFIVSCWDESSRISVLSTNCMTLDESVSLGITAFEGQYGRRPKYTSLQKIVSIELSQTMGIQVE